MLLYKNGLLLERNAHAQTAVDRTARLAPADLSRRPHPQLGQALVYLGRRILPHLIPTPSVLVADQALPAQEAWRMVT